MDPGRNSRLESLPVRNAKARRGFPPGLPRNCGACSFDTPVTLRGQAQFEAKSDFFIDLTRCGGNATQPLAYSRSLRKRMRRGARKPE